MKKTISLDSQVLNSIQSCAQKTDYNFVQHIQPLKKADALEKGSLMHTMLEVYYSLIGNCIDPKSEIFNKINEVGFTARPEKRNEAKDFALQVGQWYASTLDLPLEVCNEVIFQFDEYCKYYANDTWKPLAVERVGSKILYDSDDLRVIYNFKIDLVAQRANTIAPFDHKTSTRRETPSPLSNQFAGYAFGVNAMNVVVNKIGFQKTLKPADRFQRFFLTYSKAQLEEWQSNTIYWAHQLAAKLETNYWEKNLTSCDKYSGCAYAPICEASPALRERVIENQYHIGEKWDVALALEDFKGDSE